MAKAAVRVKKTVGLVKDKLNPALAEPRMLLTQVDARLSRHAKYAEYLRTKYGQGVLSTAIRTSSSLAAASRDGRTVYDIYPTARGALDYSASAQEIAGFLFDTPEPAAPSASVEPPVLETPAAGGDGRDHGVSEPVAPPQAASPAPSALESEAGTPAAGDAQWRPLDQL